MKLLYKNKQIKRSDDSIVKMLMPSLIGIGVCVTCLFGTTFAWFTDTASTSIQGIAFANYGLNIEIKDENGIVKGNNGIYTLSRKEDGNGYEVSITARGTATTGFCIVNDNLITNQIDIGEKLTFTLYPDSDNKEYTFTPMWGEHSMFIKGNTSKYRIINNSEIIGNTSDNSSLIEVNNNLETPNVEKVEQNNPKPEEVETIIPSEEVETITPSVETTEEENGIIENYSSNTDNEN